jgi:hypothetical protein
MSKRTKLSALNIPHRPECREEVCHCEPTDDIPFTMCAGCGIAAAPIDDSDCPICAMRQLEADD